MLSSKQLSLIKAVLQERQREAQEELLIAVQFRIGTPREASFWGVHSEAGSEDFDREMAGADETRISKFLWKIQEALICIDKMPQSFGICKSCGDMIPFERLLAVPVTRHCVNCKNKNMTKSKKP